MVEEAVDTEWAGMDRLMEMRRVEAVVIPVLLVEPVGRMEMPVRLILQTQVLVEVAVLEAQAHRELLQMVLMGLV